MSVKVSRRGFLKLLSAGAAGAAISGASKSFAKPIFYTQTPPLMPASAGNRVVIVGGGWGGVTTARHLKRRQPDTEVVLVEQRPTFMSCPISNLYLAGVVPLDFITFDYLNVVKDGIIFVNERVSDIDRDTKTIVTGAGSIAYDYLVLSPGIDYMYEAIDGYDDVKHLMPIGFKPFEHIPLRRLLDNFTGGDLIMTIPEPPFRCPPGPYERAAMLAWRLKEGNIPGKVIVLDANNQPLAKAEGFTAAYTELYSDYLEYYPNTAVEAIDYASNRLQTTFGDFDYDLANVIPPMKASPLVVRAGVGERWANVKAPFFMSEVDDDVYIIGDIVGGQPMPKSGQVAYSEGTIIAQHIAERLSGRSLGDIEARLPGNVCYSFVNETESIWVAATYAWNAEESRIVGSPSSDEVRSATNGTIAYGWANTLWNDMFA